WENFMRWYRIPSSRAFLVVMIGMSLYWYCGGGSDQPPNCFRSSSVLGLAPFCLATWEEAADAFWPAFAGGFLATSGFAGRGFLRIGRRGFGFRPPGGGALIAKGAVVSAAPRRDGTGEERRVDSCRRPRCLR